MRFYFSCFLILTSLNIGKSQLKLTIKNATIDSLYKMKLEAVEDTLIFQIQYSLCKEMRAVDLDSAFIYCENALITADKIGDPYLQAVVLHNAGIILYRKGNLAESIDLYVEAQRHYKLANKIENAMKMNNSIGLSLWKHGDFDDALDRYKKLQTWADTSNDIQFQFVSRLNSALIYTDINQEDKAMALYQEGLPIAQKAEDDKGILLHLNNMSILNRHKKKFILAHNQLQSALKLAIDIKNPDQEARVYSNIGATYIAQGKIREGINFVKKSYKINLKLKSKINLIKNTYHLAEAYNAVNEFKNAQHFADTSLYLARIVDSQFDIKLAHEILIKIYSKTKNWTSAVSAYDSVIFWQEKILNESFIQSMAEAEKKYDLAIIKHKINTLEHKAMASKSRQERSLSLVFGSFLLFIFGTVVFFYKRRANTNHQLLVLEQNHNIGLLKAQESERKRISRDLHDNVGQSLLLIKNNLTLSKVDENTQNMLDSTIDEVRSISRDLHPYKVEHLGYVGAVRSVIDQIEKGTNIIFGEDIDEDIIYDLTKDQQFQLYRITQELFNNIMKHSKASSVLFSCKKEGNVIVIIVRDNGIGMDVMKDFRNIKSLGLKTIRDRVKNLKANMELNSEKGNGLLVKLIIPITYE